MKKYSFLIYSILIFIVVGGANSCNNNKIACPTYKDSFVEKKKKVKPGAQKPEMPKASKQKVAYCPQSDKPFFYRNSNAFNDNIQ